MSDARTFWDACAEHRLVVQRCRVCGAYEYPPLPLCGSCQGDTLEWVPSSGRGRIHSSSTVHRPQDAAWNVPYVVAIVRMEEGWHMLSNVIDCAPDDVVVDAEVAVTFREGRDGRILPLFELAKEGRR